MADIKRIKTIGCSNLPIGLHALLQNRIFSLVAGVTPDKLKLTPAELVAWRENIDYEDDAARAVTASEETARLTQKDHERSKIITALFGEIRQAAKSVIPPKQEAGRKLKLIVDTYKDMPRESPNAQTQTVKGFIIDLEKVEAAPDVATLGITPIIDMLKNINTEFETIYSKRAESKKDNIINNNTAVRKENDRMLSKVFAHIEASYIYAKDDADKREVGGLIDSLNAAISAIRTTRNESVAQKKSSKKKKEKKDDGKKKNPDENKEKKPEREEDPNEPKA